MLRATRLVEQHLSETLRRGETAILERRLSLLPDDAVLSRPGLCLVQGLLEVHIARLDSAERRMEQAERALDHGPKQQNLDLPTQGGMVAEVSAAIAPEHPTAGEPGGELLGGRRVGGWRRTGRRPARRAAR